MSDLCGEARLFEIVEAVPEQQALIFGPEWLHAVRPNPFDGFVVETAKWMEPMMKSDEVLPITREHFQILCERLLPLVDLRDLLRSLAETPVQTEPGIRLTSLGAAVVELQHGTLNAQRLTELGAEIKAEARKEIGLKLLVVYGLAAESL